jgi:hypothetical protein
MAPSSQDLEPPKIPGRFTSERACRDRGRRHKPLLDVGRQLALRARRWLPGRDLVVVGDTGFSALLFLDAMRRARITAITRLRLDAALYDPAPPRPPGTIGRPRTKGARLPTLAAILAAKDKRWHAVVVPGWYGAGERTIEIASDTAVWQEEGPAAGFAYVSTQLVALFGSEVASAIRPLAATSWGRVASIGGAYSCALPGRSQARARLARPFGPAVLRRRGDTSLRLHDRARGPR